MSSVTTTPTADIPFLDGSPKQLLIGGAWVDGAAGATMPSVNPSTGGVIAEIVDADARDVDGAVVAARAAFDGPWRAVSPAVPAPMTATSTRLTSIASLRCASRRRR